MRVNEYRGKRKTDTKLSERVAVFFYWNLMSLGWFFGIFNKRIYASQEDWLISLSKKHRKV